jgi:hypothetical protein
MDLGLFKLNIKSRNMKWGLHFSLSYAITEEDIWTEEGQSDVRVEKTA